MLPKQLKKGHLNLKSLMACGKMPDMQKQVTPAKMTDDIGFKVRKLRKLQAGSCL